MRILIVGAGAVGQVYGQALQRGGAEVSFFVKPKYADEARAGFRMYQVWRGRHEARRFEGFGVVTEVAEVAARPWDQVWFAVAGPAIEGTWVEELVAAAPGATIVSLQPGAEAKARMRPVAGDRLVMGVIAFIAWQAPLPGEARFTEPGVAFWYPPGPSPFSGPRERVAPVVETLRAGGCPARAVPEMESATVFGTALLQIHVAALDAVRWSWPRARSSDVLPLAKRAWREAVAIGARTSGERAPLWAPFIGPWGVRFVMGLAPRILPMDVPTYFGYHFTKVGEQTRKHLDLHIREGTRLGLPVTALTELRTRMGDQATFDPAETLGKA